MAGDSSRAVLRHIKWLDLYAPADGVDEWSGWLVDFVRGYPDPLNYEQIMSDLERQRRFYRGGHPGGYLRRAIAAVELERDS